MLLKTAAYGLLRYVLPLFPSASAQLAPIAMWLGVLGIVYGAVCAFGQDDAKRLVAYTSISHMGFIVLGVFAGTEEALQGVIMQILAHGISAAGLFILVGEIAERLETRDLSKMGGLWARLSNLPQFGLFFILASLGLPGLGNFLGEFLILLGTFKNHPGMAMLGAVGLVLSAVYSLILMQRTFYGKPDSDASGAVAPLARPGPPRIRHFEHLDGRHDLARALPAAVLRGVARIDAGVADPLCAQPSTAASATPIARVAP